MYNFLAKYSKSGSYDFSAHDKEFQAWLKDRTPADLYAVALGRIKVSKHITNVCVGLMENTTRTTRYEHRTERHTEIMTFNLQSLMPGN